MIKVAYYEFNNLGDRLSPELVHWISGDETQCDPNYTADIFAVGSILNFYRPFYFIRKGFGAWLRRRKVQIRRFLSKKLYVWGSGFLQYPSLEPSIPMRDIEWCALRGKLTFSLLKRLPLNEPLHLSENFTLGDPGLLFERMFPGEMNIQYDFGLIPHERDQEQCKAWAVQFGKKGLQVKILDVFDSPVHFFQDIRSCDVVLSSSLHGLIIADSLGIPNRHVIFSTLGHSKEDFILKFNDYYSIYNSADLNTPLSTQDVEAIESSIPWAIRKSYRISAQQMEECRAKLVQAFPKEFIKRTQI